MDIRTSLIHPRCHECRELLSFVTRELDIMTKDKRQVKVRNVPALHCGGKCNDDIVTQTTMKVVSELVEDPRFSFATTFEYPPQEPRLFALRKGDDMVALADGDPIMAKMMAFGQVKEVVAQEMSVVHGVSIQNKDAAKYTISLK